MSLSLVVALGAGAPLGVWPASPLDAERGPMGVNLIVNPKAASGSAQWDVSENCMHSGLYGYRVVIVSPFPNAAVREADSNPRPFALLEPASSCPPSLQSAEGRTFESHSGRTRRSRYPPSLRARTPLCVSRCGRGRCCRQTARGWSSRHD